MSSTSSAVSEDVTTFDLVWMRTSTVEEEQTGPGDPDVDYGFFIVKRASSPASTSGTQTPPSQSTPTIATFFWDQFEAEFSCTYNETTDSYDGFKLVKMNETFRISFVVANHLNQDAEPNIIDYGGGMWTMDMYTMLEEPNPSYVTLWAKRRIDENEEARMTDSDLREWELGQYGIVGDEEEEGETEEEEGETEVEEGEETEE